MRELYDHYLRLDLTSSASTRFKYLLGRLYDEYGKVTKNGSLSFAKIRDRGFDFKIAEGGCQFSITSRLSKRNSNIRMARVVELWQADFEDFEFTLLGTRAWTPSDPE